MVLVIADDMGYNDIGYYNKFNDIKTPNLDKLARSVELKFEIQFVRPVFMFSLYVQFVLSDFYVQFVRSVCTFSFYFQLCKLLKSPNVFCFLNTAELA